MRESKTPTQVSLLPVVDQTRVEWTALPAFKERTSFQFGALNNPTMDLIMLQVEQTQMIETLMMFRAGCCVGRGLATPTFSLRC